MVGSRTGQGVLDNSYYLGLLGQGQAAAAFMCPGMLMVSRQLVWSRSHSNWSWSRPRSHGVLVSYVVSKRSFAFLIN